MDTVNLFKNNDACQCRGTRSARSNVSLAPFESEVQHGDVTPYDQLSLIQLTRIDPPPPSRGL